MAFTYNPYQESDAVKQARKRLEEGSVYNESAAVQGYRQQLENHLANQKSMSDWTGGTYGAAVNDALNKIQNREKFTYDLNSDALYNQYKNQYMALGQLAMQDTMGQAAALTGGYGNSYASTAGNQAYQQYLTKLNDVVPQLYGMALDQYNQEGQNLKDNWSMLNQMYNTEYGQFADQVADWQQQRDYLSNMYDTERNLDYNRFSDNRNYLTDIYNTEYNKDYGMYSDAYDRAFANYQQEVADQQWWDEFNKKNEQWQLSFDEDKRQFEAQMAQSKLEADRDYQLALANYNLSAQKAANSGNSKKSGSVDPVKPTQFLANLTPKTEFDKGRGGYKSTYGSYDKYVEAMVGNYANRGDKYALSDANLVWLMENGYIK